MAYLKKEAYCSTRHTKYLHIPEMDNVMSRNGTKTKKKAKETLASRPN
jgi:hypothetical protein